MSKTPLFSTGIEQALAALEDQARVIAEFFMSTRKAGSGRSKAEWSDLVCKVRVREGREMVIEWRRREWKSKTSGQTQGKRYVVRYLSSRALLRHAKPHEYDEVAKARKKLADIKALHSALKQLQRKATKAGITDTEEDQAVGFVPRDGRSRSRSTGGRFTEAGREGIGGEAESFGDDDGGAG